MTNATDLTPVIEAVIALCVALVTTFLIPYIKSKTTKEQQDKINSWVKIAVAAAEQMYNAPGSGTDKKRYVLHFLESKGFTIDANSLDNMIESAVYALKGGGTDCGTD